VSRVTGIDHVQVAAPPGCEADARRFYGELLGMEEIAKPEELRERGGVWFRCGEQQLHVGVQKDFRPSSKAHPAFAVTDLAGLELRLANVTKDGPRVYTADPWGNRIEILEP
jgi:catechol 2,3-dioxygenase-like lactoylglutathione lyase family enzyme